MAPRRILVTGAAGFVGRHLLPVLRADFPEAEVVLSSAEARPGFRPLDVTQPDAAAAVIRDIRPDACVHLAGIAAPPEARRNPDLAWRVNLHGTLTLARAIMAEAPECRLLLVSSAEVYGASARAGRPLDESALPAPSNTYAATKAAADLAVGAMAAEGLRAVRLRPFNHTGPGQSPTYVVAAFARQVARIEAGLQPPVMRVGALDPRRDFLDVRDVCAAYAACLRVEAPEPGLILNLASGTPRRIGDILHDLLALAGVEAGIETGGALLRPSEIPESFGDPNRAAALLGWRPAIDWGTTLRDVLNDWRRRVRDEPP